MGLRHAKAYLLLLLVVVGHLENGGHVVAKVELLEGGLDVLAGYRLLGVLFGNLVGLGGDEGDELDAAFNEQVARVFGKRHAGLAGEDVLDNLLHRGWAARVSTGLGGRVCGRAQHSPFGSDRSSLPPNSRSDMVEGCAEGGGALQVVWLWARGRAARGCGAGVWVKKCHGPARAGCLAEGDWLERLSPCKLRSTCDYHCHCHYRYRYRYRYHDSSSDHMTWTHKVYGAAPRHGRRRGAGRRRAGSSQG